MKLSEKGRYQPPPVLDDQEAQTLSETLGGWARVEARTHWLLGDETTVDGADFYVGQDELGHLHLDGQAHIAVGRALGESLLRQGLARRFRWSDDFVTWQVDSEQSRAHAQWLFSLRYDVLRGSSPEVVLRRVQEHSRRAS